MLKIIILAISLDWWVSEWLCFGAKLRRGLFVVCFLEVNLWKMFVDFIQKLSSLLSRLLRLYFLNWIFLNIAIHPHPSNFWLRYYSPSVLVTLQKWKWRPKFLHIKRDKSERCRLFLPWQFQTYGSWDALVELCQSGVQSLHKVFGGFNVKRQRQLSGD